MPFKLHRMYFFQKIKIIKEKYVCLPYVKFSDPLPETHLFSYLALFSEHCLICTKVTWAIAQDFYTYRFGKQQRLGGSLPNMRRLNQAFDAGILKDWM